MLQPADDIVDIVIQIEPAFIERHVAGVAPVRDPHVVPRQHPFDRSAQQRGIMPGHRRHDQQLRAVGGGAIDHEMPELAKIIARLDHLGNRVLLSIDDGGIKAERGLSPGRGGMGENFEGRGQDRPAPEIGKRVCRVVQQFGTGVRNRTGSGEEAALNFVCVIK